MEKLKRPRLNTKIITGIGTTDKILIAGTHQINSPRGKN